MDQTEIGKFIVKCRKEKKLTQAQLAEKLKFVYVFLYLENVLSYSLHFFSNNTKSFVLFANGVESLYRFL